MNKIRIAYIGGGSRGWARGFMSDLVAQDDFCGEVRLYDIDTEAAKCNEIIGKMFNSAEGAKSQWDYRAVDTREAALSGADFVVISILPGTFDEMESDVHTPERYGIYQSVGDTTGPGGIIRALRTIPMMEEIAHDVEKYCPEAWVINYTNPMTISVRALYRAFPQIKAFGCCHEVFGTQFFLANVLKKEKNIEEIERSEVEVNVLGVNHFTWLTEASYKGEDIFPIYAKYVKEHRKTGCHIKSDTNWINNSFHSDEMVKMNLFEKFGYIAAAGDRHLAEFCPGDWYLADPECVKRWHFALTTVDWRKKDLQDRLDKTYRILNGEEKVEIAETGEDGVKQIRALLGLGDLVTNVNLPNDGQIPNLPLGAVVETNALFRANSVRPLFAGAVPEEIYPMVRRICTLQETVAEAGANRDLEAAFDAFAHDPLMRLSSVDARKLFDTMVENTSEYLKEYQENEKVVSSNL